MKEIIGKNLVLFTNKLTNILPVLLHLRQKNLISDHEFDTIDGEPAGLKQNTKLARCLMSKDETIKEDFLAILRETTNNHLADKIEGKSSEMKCVNANISDGYFFDFEFLEIRNCKFMKNGNIAEVASISIGRTVKNLKITCDQGSKVEIKLNCLMRSMECIYFRKVRLLIESLGIGQKLNALEIGFDLVAFIRGQMEVDVVINELVDVFGLKKLSLTGNNMSVDVSGLKISAVLHDINVISIGEGSTQDEHRDTCRTPEIEAGTANSPKACTSRNSKETTV